LQFFQNNHSDILNKIRTEKQIGKELGEAIESAISAFKATL
jgi:F0F1-type ATP synthase alpha subunit